MIEALTATGNDANIIRHNLKPETPDSAMATENQIIKQSFFDHLRRQGFGEELLAAYGPYFDFFLDHVKEVELLELDPEEIYHRALAGVEDLDGDDVIEAYLKLMEFFSAFWAERSEALHPPQEAN